RWAPRACRRRGGRGKRASAWCKKNSWSWTHDDRIRRRCHVRSQRIAAGATVRDAYERAPREDASRKGRDGTEDSDERNDAAQSTKPRALRAWCNGSSSMSSAVLIAGGYGAVGQVVSAELALADCAQ